MAEAGVTMVSVNIFSWALLEPSEGVYDFSRLDRILDLLHAHGIAADLATPTAAPPAWFFVEHPEALPVDQDGRRLSYGSRQTFCPSSPAYRTAALRIVAELARRYADHPAVVMWRPQRVRLPQRGVLLRHERGGVPRLAARPLRQPERAQPRLGHHLLEPVVLRLGPDPAAPRHRRGPEPDAPAGLAPLLQRRPAVAVRGGARGPAGGGPGGREGHPGHHQLHGDVQLRRPGLLALGPEAGHRV